LPPGDGGAADARLLREAIIRLILELHVQNVK
jgi:hypothetical protein